MDPKKRTAPTDGAVAEPDVKRQALEARSPDASPRTEMPASLDEILPDFKKDAAMRRMKEYKRSATDFERQLIDLRKRSQYHEEHVKTIGAWFSQLLSELGSLCAKSEDSVDADIPKTFPLISSKLLIENESIFQTHLTDRASEIKQAFSRLAINLPSVSPDVQEIEKRVSQMQTDEKELRIQLESAQARQSELEDELNQEREKRQRAERSLDRSKSQYARQVDGFPALPATPSVKEEPQTATTVSTQEPLPLLEESVSAKESEAIISKLREELAKVEQEKEKLQAEVSRQLTRLATLSDEDYAHTDLHKALHEQYDMVTNQLNDVVAINTELSTKVRDFERERTLFRTQLEKETLAQIQDLEGKLTKVESDLIRVRQARDDLHMQVNSQRPVIEEYESAKTTFETAMVEKSSRISALEAEVSILKEQLGQNQGASATTEELAKLDSTELRERTRSLQNQYDLLSTELSAMATAYQKASQQSSEKVTIQRRLDHFVAQKAKTDERLLNNMKRLETVETENRTLRAVQATNTDFISKLKSAETQWKTLTVNLDEQLSSLKEAKAILNGNLRRVQQQLATATVTIDNLNTQIADLKKLISTKDGELSGATRAHRTTLVDLDGALAKLGETRKLADTLKKKTKSGKSQEDLMLRHIAYCTLCRRNLKDTVLKLCGHVFCHTCVEDQITSRSRKCPYCMVSFGNNDYRNIILDA